MSNEVKVTGDAGHAPDAARQFAARMSEAQGCRVVLTAETGGYHLYLPCPDCLETHGERELNDPKYAINLTRHLGLDQGSALLDKPERRRGTADLMAAYEDNERKDSRVGICMRTRQSKRPHFWSVSELLQMRTISERHPDIHTRASVTGGAGSADREQYWKPDPVTGIKCPPPPGEVIPINQLPAHHPAAEYLISRDFNLDRLYEQFRCSFCVKEYPESKEDLIFYRYMPGGWKDTPQHRIVFYSLINGTPMTWQARVVEHVDGNDRWMLHPYKLDRSPDFAKVYKHAPFTYANTHTRPNGNAAWIPVAPFDELDPDGVLKFQPSKYRTAKHSSREMMGWDAAMARAAADPLPYKWCVMLEGPLDAARIGPGGIAVIGSSISPGNAAMVAANFHIVFTAFDNDMAGRAATERVGKMIMSNSGRNCVTQLCVPLPVTGGKDVGDMTQEAADEMMRKAIRKAMRGV